jgi:hypothetical protein
MKSYADECLITIDVSTDVSNARNENGEPLTDYEKYKSFVRAIYMDKNVYADNGDIWKDLLENGLDIDKGLEDCEYIIEANNPSMYKKYIEAIKAKKYEADVVTVVNRECKDKCKKILQFLNDNKKKHKNPFIWPLINDIKKLYINRQKFKISSKRDVFQLLKDHTIITSTDKEVMVLLKIYLQFLFPTFFSDCDDEVIFQSGVVMFCDYFTKKVKE